MLPIAGMSLKVISEAIYFPLAAIITDRIIGAKAGGSKVIQIADAFVS